MTTWEAIRSRLAAATAVTDLTTTKRLYALRAPQATTTLQPTVVGRLAAHRRERATDGTRYMHRDTVEVACMAEDYDTIHALAAAVIEALDGFRGVMGGVGGVEVKSCNLSDLRDEHDPERGILAAIATFELARKP